MVRCVSCEHWTLKPRAQSPDTEKFVEMDREYAEMGWGRCTSNLLAWLWYPGETDRQCDRFIELPAAQVAARREWIAKQGKGAA